MPGDRENSLPSAGARLVRRAIGLAASTRTGLVLLGLIFLYLAAASVWPPPPGAAPGAPSRLYGLWCLKVLMGLLVASISCATVTRIPLRWSHLGAWLAHAGVIVLAGGAVWYVARHASGIAVACRSDASVPFRRVERFFIEGTRALYVIADGRDLDPPTGRQTPLSSLPPSPGARRLRVPLASPFADCSLAVTRYLPAARASLEWRDDGPVEVPAVELVVHDGPHNFRRTLCAAYPFARRFETRAYVVLLVPSVRDRALGEVPSGPAGKIDLVLIAPAGGDAAEIAVIGSDGKSRGIQHAVTGEEVKLPLSAREVGVTLVRFYTRAWLAGTASAVAPGRAQAAVRVEATVGDWRGSQWIPFQPYIRPPDPAEPLHRLPLPGGRTAVLYFAPRSRRLPRPFRIEDFRYETYPGSAKARDYVCLLEVPPAAGGGQAELLSCRLNRPAEIGRLRVYQNVWSPTPEAPREIVFQVASRPGVGAVWVGCVLVCLGLPYAFYVKPALLRRRGGARR